MARKNVLTPGPAPRTDGRKGATMPRGAVGALQSSLSKLQENAVQEIDPRLIDEAGMVDRLGADQEADASLRNSLETYGQQVPVLLRPHGEVPGRFEIVYGRRRLRALRALGRPIKAIIRQLDDHALIMAQGQENTARQELSFIEKASFCAQLDGAGYDRPTIAATLSIDLPMVSRMLKVGRAFDLGFLRKIGSAPGIGRERWMRLAELLEDGPARNRVTDLIARDALEGPSDGRFEQVFALARDEAPKPKPKTARKHTIASRTGAPIATLRKTSNATTLTVSHKEDAGFADWLEDRAAPALQDLYDRYLEERSEDPEST